MTLTTKDKTALPLAILLGVGFGYFSTLAGYGGIAIGAFYGILIVPLVVLYIANQKRILVWQACIVPYVLWVIVEDARLGVIGGAGAFVVFFNFWAIGTVISSPVVVFLYWKRSRVRAGHRVAWLFLGLVFLGLVCNLWHDPFLFFGLGFFWIAACLLRFAWEWRSAADPHEPRKATFVASLILVLTLSMGILTGVLIKQQAFRSAMKHGYFRLAHLFAKLGADPNGRDQFGETALIDAAWNGIGDLDAVNVLVSMGADVNLEQEGRLHGMLPSGTALHVAASAGRTGICNSLLQAGAAINVKNAKGETPLLLALKRGSTGCVPTLLAQGADVNARDMQGRTALMYLMNYEPGDPLIQSILADLITKNTDVSAKDADGRTAADWAIYQKHERFAEQLRSLPEAGRQPH